jgi:hypothetical protein
MQSSGLQYSPPRKYVKVDPSRGKRIADEYESMEHEPHHPLVKASYDALAKETIAQYNHAKAAGLKLSFWNPDEMEDPYAASPRLMTEDVRKNHHMYVFPTDYGYGNEPISDRDREENPMLRDTGETWNGKPVLINDMFRAIHDYFGHAKEGVGFRGDGEENAWRSHASMYSPLARLALGTETRGQNSWLNYGPHGEKNRTASTEETVFAPPKIGLMSSWVHHEGGEDFTIPEHIEAMQEIHKRHGKAEGGKITARITPEESQQNLNKFLSISKVRNGAGDPVVLYHVTPKDFSTFKAGGHDPEISGPATWLTPHKGHYPAWHNVGGDNGNFKPGTNVMPVHANITSPLVLDTPEMLDWARHVYANKSIDFPHYIHPETKAQLVEDGYDGIFFAGFHGKRHSTVPYDNIGIGEQPHKDEEIIALHPETQLKSAIGNNGNFDPSIPDVTKAKGGSIVQRALMLTSKKA